MSVVALRGRAIVSHKGIGRTTGEWKCTKDSGSSCFHINKAKALLPEDFTAIPGVGTEGEVEVEVKASKSVDSMGECSSSDRA